MTERLPLAVEEITAEWLSTALSRAGSDVVVDQVETTAIVWGTATKVLLDVTYLSGGEHLPARLCVKGGFVPELRAVMGPGYETEDLFYRDVAPHLGAGIGRCHYAEVDADRQQAIIILDDLLAAGARFCDAREPLNPDQVAAALELLAGWHAHTGLAASWLDREPYIRAMIDGLFNPLHWDAYIVQTTSGPAVELLADRDRIHRAFIAGWAIEDARPTTFVHGDANLTNVYLDAANAPRFLDWQFASRSDPYQDVTLFMIGALSIDDRRAHEEALLRGYLAARGPGAETWDDAWDAYRRHPLHGAMYALTPEEMQPASIRSALTDRFAQAALDHDTLNLLGV
jgi:Ecdysteroid kinase-like family